MSNALTEIENARPNEVLFISRYTNHKMTRVPAIDETLIGGQRRIVQQPKRIRFIDNVYRARIGKDVLVDHDGWLHRDAEQGVERDEVDALRAHRNYNKLFWEVGKEPGRLQPYEETVLEWLGEAVADLDIERLERILTGERETHNRPLLVRALSSALKTTQATRAKLEAEANDKAAAEAEAVKPAKAKPAQKAEGKLP